MPAGDLRPEMAKWDRFALLRDISIEPARGFATRDRTVLRCWAPIVGPSAVLLVQYLDELISTGEEAVDHNELGKALGLGVARAKSSRLIGAMCRASSFHLLRVLPAFGGIVVPRHVALPSFDQRRKHWPDSFHRRFDFELHQLGMAPG